MAKSPPQSDVEFIRACGFDDARAAAPLAVALRRDLAKFGRRQTQTIRADDSIVSRGFAHPYDSMSLLDYSLMLEHITEVKLEPDELTAAFPPEGEEMTVGEWVRRMVALCREKGGRGFCAACGQNLRGTRSAERCPECGVLFLKSDATTG